MARRFLGEACRDPDFTAVFRANLNRRLELVTAVIDRGVRCGAPRLD